MKVHPGLEAPRAAARAPFGDALTIAFGDARAELYGVARLGLDDAGASGMAILFHRGDAVAVAVEGGVAVDDRSSWSGVSAAGLDTEVVEPLMAWRLHFAGADAAFDLDLAARGEIATLDEGDPVARLGGMAGYEQLVSAAGEARVAGERIVVDGRGQRGRSWGAPDPERVALARTVSAWLDGDVGVWLTALRPHGARDHAGELVAATVFEDGEPPTATRIADPRLSTTYDGDGRPQAAGVELWVDDDSPPRRGAGELVCATSVDLGRLRLDCAFLRWRMEGRTGFGRYDILRRL